jgi:hypothetical protein
MLRDLERTKRQRPARPTPGGDPLTGGIAGDKIAAKGEAGPGNPKDDAGRRCRFKQHPRGDLSRGGQEAPIKIVTREESE